MSFERNKSVRWKGKTVVVFLSIFLTDLNLYFVIKKITYNYNFRIIYGPAIRDITLEAREKYGTWFGKWSSLSQFKTIFYLRRRILQHTDSFGSVKIKHREISFSSNTENIHNNDVQLFLYNPFSQVHFLSFFEKCDLPYCISPGLFYRRVLLLY